MVGQMSGSLIYKGSRDRPSFDCFTATVWWVFSSSEVVHVAQAGSRLHDFGCRGCTCAEQTVLGGVAHLLNFDGTDTMSAAYYAQARPTPYAA